MSTHDRKTESALTRRDFMHLLPGLGAGLCCLGQIRPDVSGLYRMPPGRVAHIHDEDAVSWNFSSGWYGYYVDQTKVDAMVKQGLLTLTGKATVPQAWNQLIPHYVPGGKIAIKINFNNYSSTGPDPDNDINALIEPVNALISTLIDFGVYTRDITVYDVTKGWHNGGIPQNSFINRCLYPGVNFLAYVGNPNPFSATEKVRFNCPPPPSPQIPDLPICNALAESDYLINMPLVKAHPFGYVTLGMKNHFGSIKNCQDCHGYMPNAYSGTDYSVLVDIFKNTHFRDKTVLTVGDGLFGNWYNVSGTPKRWKTFRNNAPRSLFFSADPVAIDSVMADFIDFERQQQGYGKLNQRTRYYLAIAEAEGLGIFEQGDPWLMPPGSGYDRIDYRYVDGV